MILTLLRRMEIFFYTIYIYILLEANHPTMDDLTLLVL